MPFCKIALGKVSCNHRSGKSRTIPIDILFYLQTTSWMNRVQPPWYHPSRLRLRTRIWKRRSYLSEGEELLIR